MKTIEEIISALKSQWSIPKNATRRYGKTSTELVCKFSSKGAKLPKYYPYRVPEDLISFWDISKSAVLFNDAQYGQWGLQILSPTEALLLTKSRKGIGSGQLNNDDLRDGELIIGKFIGDNEVLILSCASDETYNRVLVSMPIDPRNEWPVVGENFFSFLIKYVKFEGDMFWEYPDFTTS